MEQIDGVILPELLGILETLAGHGRILDGHAVRLKNLEIGLEQIQRDVLTVLALATENKARVDNSERRIAGLATRIAGLETRASTRSPLRGGVRGGVAPPISPAGADASPPAN